MQSYIIYLLLPLFTCFILYLSIYITSSLAIIYSLYTHLLAHESFGNPLSVLAMNSASNDTLLPSDNKDLTIKISSSYILPEGILSLINAY